MFPLNATLARRPHPSSRHPFAVGSLAGLGLLSLRNQSNGGSGNSRLFMRSPTLFNVSHLHTFICDRETHDYCTFLGRHACLGSRTFGGVFVSGAGMVLFSVGYNNSVRTSADSERGPVQGTPSHLCCSLRPNSVAAPGSPRAPAPAPAAPSPAASRQRPESAFRSPTANSLRSPAS